MNAKTESQDGTHIETMVDNVCDDIIGNYPIFDEAYRHTLNKKIIKHYYTREIGYETVGLWKFKLNTMMNEIMPYFNKLYESELIVFDPMRDYEMERKYSKVGSENEISESEKNYNDSSRTDKTKNENNIEFSDREYSENKSKENTSNSQSTNFNSENTNGTNKDSQTVNEIDTSTDEQHSTGNNQTIDKYSDTPQGAISGLLTDTYLTNANVNNTNGTTDNNGDVIKTNVQNTLNENSNDTNKESNSMNNSTETSNEKGDNSGTDSTSKNNNMVGNENESKSGESNQKTSGTNVANNLEEYIEHIVGKKAITSYSKLLLEFRETFLNIDLMIINKLDVLFMGVW